MRILLLIIGFTLSQLVLADKVVKLTSLDWPPYSGKALNEQGASVAVAKAAFAAMGYTLEVDFFPWSRAVSLAKSKGSAYAGYFPEYHSDAVAEEFTYSQPMGSGPLGFVEQSAKPVTWSSLDDLKSYRIGVVQDYVNTTDFDAMMNSGQLKTEAVISDKNNILKVVNGRLDLAVIDRNVMDYLFKTDKALSGKEGKASFNGKLLEDKKLYICFKKTPGGAEMAKIFNEGLKKIDVNAIMAKHI
ncbi:MAG: transporter substrate-binding domain-containing protein [Saccharospirillaceae bacterium]|nr:ABC transporter [Thalassolituus sp. HI0120]MCH2040845.1 transporter substrate-binding domain-containing protein [Saccharospirillaceae bacterium]